jgi:tyrosyl-tRNA synthetase
VTIDEQVKIIRRGIVDLVSEEDLRKKLARDVPLRIKVGFDPTAPDLHLGHTVVMHKMRQFQELGHDVTFLIGDFTGRIGDPSGKSKTRPPLTEEQVKKNAETYKAQVFKILDPQKTTVRFNSEWGDSLTPAAMLKLMSCCTVARMMERDDFAKRYAEQSPIAIHEFMYPLLQAYDSVVLRTDVEMGGTDQIFNLLMGRTLQGHYGIESQCAITVPLLVGLDGVTKMSKSHGNYIGVMEPPADQFGKAMSISDDLMWNWYELISVRSMEEISDMRARVQAGTLHPKLVKEDLAFEIVARYWGEEAAQSARDGFNNVFARGGIPEDAITWSAPEGEESTPVSILAATGLVPSRGEAKRKIAAGSLKVNGEKLTDGLTPLPAGEYTLKYGKKGFVVLTVKNDG